MSVQVKICGITTPEMVQAVAQSGASHIGLMFYPPSPRNLPMGAASDLASQIPAGLQRVGVFVDPTDDLLELAIATTQLDMVQLHGNESPLRVAEVKDMFGLPVMKAFPVRDRADVQKSEGYEGVADLLLFDAKPPKNSATNLPGGTGHTFDWTLLKDRQGTTPWALSGGLNPDNVVAAIRETGAGFVDVSSGVEDAPGVKNMEKIAAFMAAIREHFG